MKTTLDLPDDLMRAIKIRAVRDNRKLKDAVADLLRRSLAREPVASDRTRRVQLPLIQCKHRARPQDEMTPDGPPRSCSPKKSSRRVVLCDSNLWLALALSKHVHHAAARQWLNTVEDARAIFFCRATQQAFLRLLTNTAVLAPYGNVALTNRQAWQVYEALLSDDRIVLRAEEPAGLEVRWKQFAVRNTASPKLWMDAYLAAYALAGGHRLVTTDVAFRQFRGLDLELVGNDAR